MPGHDVIVIGGGIAGLTAAIGLRASGHRVRLFEQAASIEPLGAAISLWGNALAALDRLGCGDAVRACSAPIDTLRSTTRAGATLFGPVDVSGSDSWLVRRADLQRVLLEAAGADTVTLGTRIETIDETGARVRATDQHGDVHEADALVLADGIHSAHATALLGNPPAYRGYKGFLGLAEGKADGGVGISEEIWDGTVRAGLFGTYGGGQYWFVMYAAGEDEEMTPGALHALMASWPERVREAVLATPHEARITGSIHARDVPKRLGEGRRIAIGDAAHAMEPNLGQGACQGIEDADALARIAATHAPGEWLGALEKARLKRIAHYMNGSARIGTIAHRLPEPARAATEAFMRVTPRAVDRWVIGQEIRPPKI